MNKDKPFIDSHGARGYPGYPYNRYHTDHKKIKSIGSKSLQFELSDGKLLISIPDTIITPTKVQITKLNALRLAHWLLDVTASPSLEK